MLGRLSTLLGAALLALALLAPTAVAKPRCGGKKATIVGGPGNDRIKPPNNGHGTQVIFGGGGNDTILSGEGKDRVCGGDGNDRIIPGRGPDKVYGGEGEDYVQNQKGMDRINGEGGDDNLNGGPSADDMLGGSGNDFLGGGGKGDKMSGGPGEDHLFGDDGPDEINGDDGDDIVRGASGGDTVRGGPGNDTVQGDLLDDFMFGDSGNDVMVGGHGIDEMRAGSGDDWLRGGTNQDAYKGEAGTDTASFATATPQEDQPGVTVSLPNGFAKGDGGRDTISGVENVLGSAFSDEITGSSDNNRLDGSLGNDEIDGGAGLDTTDGGPGNDQCKRGEIPLECGISPAPQIPADNRPQQAFAWMNETGPDPGLIVLGRSPSAGTAAASEVDDIAVNATPTSYRVTSPTGTPVVEYPNGFCDEISPNGASCPKPAQALGYIMIFGDGGDDRLKVVGGGFPAAMTADLDGGTDSDQLQGSPGDDVLFSGHTGRDQLRAGGGSDALIAEGLGADTLSGEEGNDQLVTDDPCQGHDYSGGAGFDIAGFGRYDRAIAGKGSVKATMGGRAVDPDIRRCAATRIGGDLEILEGSAGNDILNGFATKQNFLIIGREGADVITGGSRPDMLIGQAGPDTILGMGGFDNIDAKDGERDKRIDCGKGSGEAKTDGKDPKAKNCKKG